MYTPRMKSIVKYALELDLIGLEIKEGYNGAPLLTVTSGNKDHIDKLSKFTKYIAKEINVYREKSEDETIWKLAAVFGEDTVDNSYYQIKN